jgi:hypothetical protein
VLDSVLRAHYAREKGEAAVLARAIAIVNQYLRRGNTLFGASNLEFPLTEETIARLGRQLVTIAPTVEEMGANYMTMFAGGSFKTNFDALSQHPEPEPEELPPEPQLDGTDFDFMADVYSPPPGFKILEEATLTQRRPQNHGQSLHTSSDSDEQGWRATLAGLRDDISQLREELGVDPEPKPEEAFVRSLEPFHVGGGGRAAE